VAISSHFGILFPEKSSNPGMHSGASNCSKMYELEIKSSLNTRVSFKPETAQKVFFVFFLFFLLKKNREKG
jgi:hypothetical protein